VQSQLAELAESLESAQNRVRRLSDQISDSAWNQHTGPDRWSAADCVEHLNITSRAYIPRFRTALAEARQLRTPPRKKYRRDALGRAFAFLVGPRNLFGKLRLPKIKTLEGFVPKGGQTRTELLSEFVRLQGDLLTIVRSADGLPIDRVSVVSPFGETLTYNAYSALVIVANHQHRHIDQAEAAAGR
jgi:hypothetical protein